MKQRTLEWDNTVAQIVLQRLHLWRKCQTQGYTEHYQNKFQLSESKCKEPRISFAKSAADLAPIVINGNTIEVVSTVKLLGLNRSSDLRWNCHVAEISKKVASRLYFLKQLKTANIPAKDLLIFYLTCIRPVTEYACPVFHNALPTYLSAELEQLQKRAMRIFFPSVSYSDALHKANLDTLPRRIKSITNKLLSLVTQTINYMSICHLVTIVNPI